jgi:hypothetical protein
MVSGFGSTELDSRTDRLLPGRRLASETDASLGSVRYVSEFLSVHGRCGPRFRMCSIVAGSLVDHSCTHTTIVCGVVR